MWFDGVKGKIIFGVDVFLLIILPIILLIALVEAFKSTKDFLFTLLTSTIIMMVTFVVKLVYLFLYRKYWKDIEFYDDKKDKNQELFNLNDE
jgi:isoprenylcysteine carboxyl methyltransferase (ICMT) family protein YpbQ